MLCWGAATCSFSTIACLFTSCLWHPLKNPWFTQYWCNPLDLHNKLALIAGLYAVSPSHRLSGLVRQWVSYTFSIGGKITTIVDEYTVPNGAWYFFGKHIQSIEPGSWELWAGCPWRGWSAEWRRHLPTHSLEYSDYWILFQESPARLVLACGVGTTKGTHQSVRVCHHRKMKIHNLEPSMNHPRASPQKGRVNLLNSLGRPLVCLNLGYPYFINSHGLWFLLLELACRDLVSNREGVKATAAF